MSGKDIEGEPIDPGVYAINSEMLGGPATAERGGSGWDLPSPVEVARVLARVARNRRERTLTLLSSQPREGGYWHERAGAELERFRATGDCRELPPQPGDVIADPYAGRIEAEVALASLHHQVRDPLQEAA